MAKEEKEEKTTKKSDRQARWEKHLENYALRNPVKFASKKEKGEFKEIPASFI